MAVENKIEQYLNQYEQAKKEFTGRAEELAGKETPETFQSRLERRLAQRELYPKTRAREREVISELFAEPRAIRKRLEDVHVHPSEVSGVVGDRMQTYLTELDELKADRKARQDRIDDIIESVATGYESQQEREAALLDVSETRMDTAWDEYREAVRQYEKQQSLDNRDSLGTLTERQSKARMDIASKLSEMKTAHLQRDPEGWDGKISNEQYLELIDIARKTDQEDWFISSYNPRSNVTINWNKQLDQQLRTRGINMDSYILEMSKEELMFNFKDDLINNMEDENDARNIYQLYDRYVDFTDINSEFRRTFRRKLIEKFGTSEGSRIFDEQFGTVGSAGGAFQNPETGEWND